MPNWCTNHLVITGDEKNITDLRKQVSTPYQSPYDEGAGMVEGEFLLWNIIRPLNVEAYLDSSVRATPEGMTFAEHYEHSVATGQDWWHWNVREWGTKWEISESDLNASETSLSYCFDTAWSPPCEALDKLAEQYPTLAFTIRFIDEGGGFAGETMWADGNRIADIDLAINHDTMTEFWGYCTICNDEDEEARAENQEFRAEYGCPDD